MQIRVIDLKLREVINICTGMRLGFVCDVVMNTSSGQVIAIVVPGRCKVFGLFGREDDYIIPWECIRKISDDIILVEINGEYQREKRIKKFWM